MLAVRVRVRLRTRGRGRIAVGVGVRVRFSRLVPEHARGALRREQLYLERRHTRLVVVVVD